MKIRPVVQSTEEDILREGNLPRPKVIDDLAHFQEASGALKLISDGVYNAGCGKGFFHVNIHTNECGQSPHTEVHTEGPSYEDYEHHSDIYQDADACEEHHTDGHTDICTKKEEE